MQGVGPGPQSPPVAAPRPQQEGVQDAQLVPTPGRAGSFQVISICCLLRVSPVKPGLGIRFLTAWHIFQSQAVLHRDGVSHSCRMLMCTRPLNGLQVCVQIVLAQPFTMLVCRELMFPPSPPSLLGWLTLRTSAS